jgi:hypothetical protein
MSKTILIDQPVPRAGRDGTPLPSVAWQPGQFKENRGGEEDFR